MTLVMGMQLSEKWIRMIMQGTSAEEGAKLPMDLIKLTLAQSAYIPEKEHQELTQKSSSATSPCPAFMRKAFRECLAEKQFYRLRELYLICLRYNISVPGEMMPECLALYDPDNVQAIQTLSALQKPLRFLGEYFPGCFHFSDLDQDKWDSLKPKERKIHLQSRLAWSLSRQAFEWIPALAATERTDLLSSFVYLDWDGKRDFAEAMAGSQSKKANAWTNAYLLKYADSSISQIALRYFKKEGIDKLDFKEATEDLELPFPIAIPNVLENSEQEWIHLLSWTNPALLFSSSDMPPQEFSRRILDQKAAPEIALALLHAAIYHHEADWIDYVFELVSYGELYEIWDAESPSKLLSDVPNEYILRAFHRDLEKAETDMDRLDAVYHWLFAGDLFLSKEITEKVWPAIVNGVDLLSVGGISSGKYKPFFDWVQFRIYPGFPIHWSIQKSGLVHEFQQSVNKRYHFYKSLNAWLKRNQSN